MKYFGGCDVGSTYTKAVILDENGKMCADTTIRSNTGEHELNTTTGSFTLNTPHAQGVAAFFKNQRSFTLGSFSVESGNDYGTCVAVSLDGKPLAASAKVLIQCGTNTLPSGWTESAAPAEAAKPGKKGAPDDLRTIDSIGKAPWMMEKVRMTITLKNTALTKATALDANGYAAAEVKIARDGGSLRLTLPEDALHVVLE